MHAWWFLFVLLWGAASALAQEVSPLLVKRANSGQTRLASSLLAVRELVAREGMATLRALSLPGLRRATADTLEVYLHVTALTPATLAALHREGVQVYRTSSRFGLVYAAVPWAALEAVAALPFVRWLRLPVYAVRRTGSVTSRGDEVMGVQALRAQLGVDGSGVRVGIISDSLTRFQEAVASGDLPADLLVLEPGDPRDSNEGRAMAEIVHDLAPGATLLFHSGFPTSLDMIAAVEALVAAGADIIVDDVGFLDEPVFEDGPVAQAVQQAVAQGVLYVTAAGNSADRHYQGPYQEFNPHDGDPEVNLHDFGGGDPTLAVTLAAGGSLVAVLQWPNPFDASANTADYDLFLLDESGQREACTLPGLTGVCASTDVQLGGPAPPLEVVTLTNLTGAAVTVTLVINRAAGEALPLVLNLDGEVTLREHGVAAGSVFGHPCLRQALAVGAIDAADPGFDTLEPFSAWGPCALAFPFADTRSKPDLVAADGVDTTLPDFAPFFGTSAAAPHVAAIAALLMEATGGPGARPATAIANALRLLAVDLPPAGPDNRSGHGALVVDAARVQDVLLSGRNTPPQSVIDAPADDVVVAPGTAVAFQGSCVDVQDEDGFAFRWDFSGVAPPSTAPRPVVPFPTTGRFEVTLTCTDRDGAADATPAMRTVTVNEPPQSHIDEPAADVRVTAGSAVRFAGSCSDAEGDEPFAFLWFFGGGTTPASSTQPVPGALVFDTPGTFVVTLRCTDALGLADPTPAAVRITVVAPGGGGGGGCTLLAGQTPALSPWEALGVLLVWLGVPALVRRLGRRRQRRAP